jgi:hypothetical protein
MNDQKNNNVIKHDWGYELIWANTKDYCGKIFYFNQIGSKTPFFFNSDTDKTFFISVGEFLVKWIDTKTGNILQAEIKEGQVWHCPKLQPCSFEARKSESSLHIACASTENDQHIILKPEAF